MKDLKHILSLLSLPAIICPVCFFQMLYAGSAGTSGAAILKEVIGGRQAGMAEAFVAVADDVNTLQYNPAGLTNINNKREMSVMYAKSFVDMSHMYTAYAHNFGNPGAIGASVFIFEGGDLEWDGELVKVQQDYVYTVGYAKQVFNRLSLGVNAKMINSTLVERYKATAYAADLGILYKTPLRGLSMGASLQHIGTNLTYIEVGDPLPRTLRLGTAYTRNFGAHNKFIIALDAVKLEENTKYNVGAEWTYHDIITCRCGYKIGYDLESYTIGVGLSWKGLKFDWGQIPMGELEQLERMSFTMGYKQLESMPSSPELKVSEETRYSNPQETAQSKSTRSIIEELLKKARTAIMNKQYRRAVSYCEAALKIDSGNMTALLLLAEAQKAIEKKIKPIYERAKVLCSGGDYHAALSKFEIIKKIDTADSVRMEVYKRLLKVAAITPEEKRQTRYAEIFRKAVNDFVDEKYDIRLSYIRLRYIFGCDKKYIFAGKLMEMLEKEYPQITAWERPPKDLSLIKHKLYTALREIYDGHYDDAIRACDDVLLLEPDNITALKRLGSAYYALDEVEKAKLIWQKAKKINPEDKELKSIEKKLLRR